LVGIPAWRAGAGQRRCPLPVSCLGLAQPDRASRASASGMAALLNRWMEWCKPQRNNSLNEFASLKAETGKPFSISTSPGQIPMVSGAPGNIRRLWRLLLGWLIPREWAGRDAGNQNGGVRLRLAGGVRRAREALARGKAALGHGKKFARLRPGRFLQTQAGQ